jgi:hypothetical protein
MHSASTADHVIREKRPGQLVTYFFLQYDDPRTMEFDFIMRSIIRQAAELIRLPEDIVVAVEIMVANPVPKWSDYADILGKILSVVPRLYIFLDAIDECDKTERQILLHMLSWHLRNSPGLKVFISTRQNIVAEIRKMVSKALHVSIASSQAANDIGIYVRQVLQERVESEDFVARDQELLAEIEARLIGHADGMCVTISSLSELPLLTITTKVSLGYLLDTRGLCPILRRGHSSIS